VCIVERPEECIIFGKELTVTKESTWYAVLTGSVASTVDVKITEFFIIKTFFTN